MLTPDRGIGYSRMELVLQLIALELSEDKEDTRHRLQSIGNVRLKTILF
jgi:hypothetical protein